MAFLIQDATTIIPLPDPVTGNTESLSVSTTVRRAMDGTLFSYKKSSDRKLYSWAFTNVKNNFLDSLRTFINANRGATVRITTADGLVINGVFREDNLTTASETCQSGEVSLSFEG